MYVDARGFLHAVPTATGTGVFSSRGGARHESERVRPTKRRHDRAAAGRRPGPTTAANLQFGATHNPTDNSAELSGAGDFAGRFGHGDVSIIRGVGSGRHFNHRPGGTATKASLAASEWNGERCWICAGWRPVRSERQCPTALR